MKNRNVVEIYDFTFTYSHPFLINRHTVLQRTHFFRPTSFYLWHPDFSKEFVIVALWFENEGSKIPSCD